MSQYNILVVDDDREIVRSLGKLLELEGYRVKKAYNGMEALDILMTEQIHLILLDVMMPKMNGLSALMKIREKNNIPIIMLSAKGETFDKVLGLELGADDYMVKPVDDEEMLLRISALLRRSNIANEHKLHAGGTVLDYDALTVTSGGNTYELPDPFVVIATQNPIGSIGTQKLPESQLDRFMIKLSMGYPQIEDEVAIMKSRLENGKNTQFSACVLEKGDIEGIREEVAGIYVDDSIYEYVAKIAAKTRSRENIIQGVSPRGSIAVIAMAKAEAFLRGNNYVLPSDIKNIAVETFAHRIVTNVNGAAGTEAARKEITEILRNVPVPEMNK